MLVDLGGRGGGGRVAESDDEGEVGGVAFGESGLEEGEGLWGSVKGRCCVGGVVVVDF